MESKINNDDTDNVLAENMQNKVIESQLNPNEENSFEIPEIRVTDDITESVPKKKIGFAETCVDIDPSPDSADAVPSTSFVDESTLNNLTINDENTVYTIEVRGAGFAYGKNDVLNDVTIRVPKGKIYALLGSSGCGKTTLLRMCLGRLKPKYGSIKVFGIKPGSEWSNIPGPGVGYMPQELAMATEFSISETIHYFGKLYHLQFMQIEERIEFLVKLLNLPDRDREISKMSGGQQRRASIALTLFHGPNLIILDEPTVGVDPVLRLRIWEYLDRLCRDTNATVIVTTHYIEEAKSASTIAFMRFGRILTESNPEALLKQYNTTILEDVFFKMCQTDTGEIKRKSLSIDSHRESIGKLKKQLGIEKPENGVPKGPPLQKNFDTERIKALVIRNYQQMIKNRAGLFLFLLLPVTQIFLFHLTFGKAPKNLPVAYYNPEAKGELTTAFINKIDHRFIIPEEFASLEDAVQSVRKGNSWFAITTSRNFSEAFDIRATEPNQLDDDLVNASKILMYADMSNSVIGPFIERSLIESFQKFIEEHLVLRGFDTSTVTVPIKIHELVYGKMEFSFEEFLGSGTVAICIYAVPLILVSFQLVKERKDNVLERSIVAGVRPHEVLISHLIVLSVILIAQVALTMIMAYFIFEMTQKGSFIDVFLLTYLSGLQGIGIGFMISALSPNEVVAVVLSFGITVPIWVSCGLFWPLQGIPNFIHVLLKMFNSMTLPIEALRAMTLRGWNVLEHGDVQIGYMISIIYIIASLVFTFIYFRKTCS